MNILDHAFGLQGVKPQAQKLALGKKPLFAAAKEPVISQEGIDRWMFLELLTKNRRALGLNTSQIAVLKALFKYFPKGRLPIGRPHRIEASNRKLQEYADRMPSSTFGRTLRLLEKKGYISRDHFGNGKRKPAFGSYTFVREASDIDIRPLIDQAEMIVHQVAVIRLEELRQQALRTLVKEMRREIRDMIARVAHPASSEIMDVLNRYTGNYRMPRNADSRELQEMLDQHTCDRDALVLSMGISGTHFEHPIHMSNTGVKYIDSYLTVDGLNARAAPQECAEISTPKVRALDAYQVARSGPELLDFMHDKPINMANLLAAADVVRRSFRVADSLWRSVATEGTLIASIIAVCIVLKDQAKIMDHGAYLATMLRKLKSGAQEEWQLFSILDIRQAVGAAEVAL